LKIPAAYGCLLLLFVFNIASSALADALSPNYQESITLSRQHADGPTGWIPTDNSIVTIPGDGSTDAQYGLKYDASGNLVVRTFTKSSYYSSDYVDETNYKIFGSATSAAAWVTTGKDATTFLDNNGVSAANVTDLLERGLGMNNTGTHDVIIEYTIAANNDKLMRPTKNPDITAYSTDPANYGTSASFPASAPGGMSAATYANFKAYYNYWVTQTYDTAVTDSSAFPWTQLGYTFFWGNGETLANIKGMSEFIILGKTVVGIYGIYSPQSYIYTKNDGSNFSSAATAE